MPGKPYNPQLVERVLSNYDTQQKQNFQFASASFTEKVNYLYQNLNTSQPNLAGKTISKYQIRQALLGRRIYTNKLTDRQKDSILHQYNVVGTKVKDIAAEYNVSKSHIYDILNEMDNRSDMHIPVNWRSGNKKLDAKIRQDQIDVLTKPFYSSPPVYATAPDYKARAIKQKKPSKFCCSRIYR